jgi:lipoprotein-anchoring transpeptidase ErfK/SrfK
MKFSRRRLEQILAVLLLGVGAVVFAIAAPNKTRPAGSRTAAQAPSSTFKPIAEIAANPGYQELAALLRSQQVFRSPGSGPFQRIERTRPITGEQTVLPVIRQVSEGGSTWLRVRLPGRPNGLTGWIHRAGTRLEYTRWKIVISRAKRRVYVYKSNRLVRSFESVVGAPSTPTPRGTFFVEENVALSPTAVGYPYALALSARSDVFQEFDGGPGQIALHGLDNVGGTLGTAASHGCVRLDTSDITWLAKHVDTGVPVVIN